MAVDGHFRVIAAQTTTAVETAREILDLAPVAADALGRAMTGALLLARLLDKERRNQFVSLRFEGNGPLGTVIGDGTVAGNVRGYVANPVPEDPMLDVESAIGNGSLTVVRGTPPAGKPYASQILLAGTGIATDLTRYLMRSEQIASAVLLGVFNRREGVAAAGGMIIQAFPHTPEEAICTMEGRSKMEGRIKARRRSAPPGHDADRRSRGRGCRTPATSRSTPATKSRSPKPVPAPANEPCAPNPPHRSELEE